MNKKVYFNNNFILFCSGHIQPTGNQLIVGADNLDKSVLASHIRHFTQQNEGKDLILISENPEQLFEESKKLFFFIEAAGGLIEQNNKYLFIYRLGKWDLPKGKIDKGESPVEAAVRECEEECAISGLKVVTELAPTYHIYPYKGMYALKITYWFKMESSYNGELVPQASENIEKAEWLGPESIKNVVLQNTYPSVRDVIFPNLDK